MEPVETLQDFALNLLNDADAMSAFDSDPTGVLQAAGLGDVTAQDIHEILPLVADYASTQELGDIGSSLDLVNELDAVSLSHADINNLGNLAGSTAIAEDMVDDLADDIGLGQAFDTTVLDKVANSGDLVQDVVGGHADLSDVGVGDTGIGTGIDAVDDLTSTVGDVTGAVGAVDAGGVDVSDGLDLTDGLDAHTAVDDTIGDVTGNLSGNLSDLHHVVGDVGLAGNVTDVVGGLDVGGIDIGGIGNGNDLEF